MSLFHKKKLTANFLPINSAMPMAKLTVKQITKQKQG